MTDEVHKVTTILGLAAGPEANGRTSAGVAAVLAGAAKAGAATQLLQLSSSDVDLVLEEVAIADAVVIGSPVYRASFSALLKGFLESLERGMWGESTAPLQGKAAALVMTGASRHHFLALRDLRDVLAGFFAVQVLSPGLYLDHGAYLNRATIDADAGALAAGHGAALVDLAEAVRRSSALSSLRPQV
jgi:FMN reductase